MIRALDPPAALSDDLEARIDRVLSEASEGVLEVGFRSRMFKTGVRRSVFNGVEGEFVQAKQFTWGADDPRTILSRATMRSAGETIYCRVSRPETKTCVYVLADIGRTHDFGHFGESKQELLARAFACVCMSVKDSHDVIKAALFGFCDGEKVFRMPRAQDPNRIVRKLVGDILEPEAGLTEDVETGGFAQALKILSERGQQDVVILSDFLSMTGEHEKLIADVAQNNCVRAVVVQDLRERELPQGPRWLPFPVPIDVFDLSTGARKKWWLTAKNRSRYTQAFEEHEVRLHRFFKAHGVSFETIGTESGAEANKSVLGLLSCPSR